VVARAAFGLAQEVRNRERKQRCRSALQRGHRGAARESGERVARERGLVSQAQRGDHRQRRERCRAAVRTRLRSDQEREQTRGDERRRDQRRSAADEAPREPVGGRNRQDREPHGHAADAHVRRGDAREMVGELTSLVRAERNQRRYVRNQVRVVGPVRIPRRVRRGALDLEDLAHERLAVGLERMRQHRADSRQAQRQRAQREQDHRQGCGAAREGGHGGRIRWSSLAARLYGLAVLAARCGDRVCRLCNTGS
jgi:hypothetical protein